MTWLSDGTLEHLRLIADEPDLSGTRYELVERLGMGGMASVYLVRDRELERLVAMKVLRETTGPELEARLRREARVIGRLEHPGIVPVHDIGTLGDGRLYYTMKVVRGRRLDELDPTASLADRLRVFERICEAVAFAHAHGVIHRDLKPQNIMVGPFGEVMVMDWGLARVAAEPEPAPHASDRTKLDAGANQTMFGQVMGTPGYMAPEQERGATDQIDARTDVYGLGAVLHFLLTGLAPDKDPERSALRIQARPLKAICNKALSPLREDRYASAEELGRDIACFLDQQPVSAYRENVIEVLSRWCGKYRAAITLVAAYLVMRLLLLFFASP